MYFFYYLPVGIDAETRRFPFATWGIALLCVVVFAANRFFGSLVPGGFRDWIYFPGYSGVITTLSAAFVHFDYFHIVSNLIYLVLFGRYLEDRMGTLWFALLFAGSAMAGNMAQGWYNLN